VKLELEKQNLERRFVERYDKPPRQMAVESTNQGALEEIQ
jgi:hypothetical protein